MKAAVDLHTTLGPARTTVSQIAQQAGVQRHTFYAHFPDDRSLFLACSAFAMEQDPLPEVEEWRLVPPGAVRLRRGLEEIYGWYERNTQQAACVLRDAEHHALTREMVELRMKPFFIKAASLLGEGLGPRSGALLAVALDFACWRALRDTHIVEDVSALMSDAVLGLTDREAGSADKLV